MTVPEFFNYQDVNERLNAIRDLIVEVKEMQIDPEKKQQSLACLAMMLTKIGNPPTRENIAGELKDIRDFMELARQRFLVEDRIERGSKVEKEVKQYEKASLNESIIPKDPNS